MPRRRQKAKGRGRKGQGRGSKTDAPEAADAGAAVQSTAGDEAPTPNTSEHAKAVYQTTVNEGSQATPEFNDDIRLELVSGNKWGTLPVACQLVNTRACMRAYEHIPGMFYVLAMKNKAGEVVKFQGNDNAFMEFFQTDPEMGTHLVARLKSSGGYKADGMHYFAAHRYLLPGTFTVRFGAGTRTSRKHGNLRAVSYTTLVKDPELELLEAERRRIVEMQRHELSARDQRFIKSLKPTAMLSDTACADVAASLNKSTEAVKAYIKALIETQNAKTLAVSQRGRRRKGTNESSGPPTGVARRKSAVVDHLGNRQFLEFTLQPSAKRKRPKSMPLKVLRKLRRYAHDPLAADETVVQWNTKEAVVQLATRVEDVVRRKDAIAQRRMAASPPAPATKKPLFDDNEHDVLLASLRGLRTKKQRGAGSKPRASKRARR